MTSNNYMVFTKGATLRLLEWTSQKEKEEQSKCIEFFNQKAAEEEKIDISVMTGWMVESIIREYETEN